MKRTRSFGDLLYRSFQETYGPGLSIAGLLLAVVGYYIVPSEDTIATRNVVIAAAICLYIFFILVRAAYIAHEEKSSSLPEARYGANAPKGYGSAVALLLLDQSELFSHDSLAAIYIETDGFEQLIGLGRVINIQENGKIQVLVIHSMQDSEEWDEIKKNNASKLNRLIVKPNIPGFLMEEVQNA